MMLKQQIIFFFYCVHSGTFWEDLQDWISTKLFLPHPLNREDIVFETTLRDKRTDLMLKNLLILAKFFIHICKWGSSKPKCSALKRYLRDKHLNALRLVKRRYGEQLLDAYEDLKIFDENEFFTLSSHNDRNMSYRWTLLLSALLVSGALSGQVLKTPLQAKRRKKDRTV